MLELSLAQKVAIAVIPVLFAITVHEVAHGWVARRCGDPTAYMMGRLTLNPLKHIDPIGTVAVPLVLLLLGGFVFGWAKPVPVSWRNLRNPKRDMALVAAAGPIANLIMALIWALIIKVGLFIFGFSTMLGQWLILMGSFGITINVVLMVLNLLPLPPLDGGRIVSSLLPPDLSTKFDRIEPYGIVILLLLLATGTLAQVMSGPVQILERALHAMIGL